MKRTLQETFDEALVQFRALNAKLETGRHSPMRYKQGGEDNCPVGRFIPQEDYDILMENTLCTQEAVGAVLKKHGYDPYFCRVLQLIHDCTDRNRWEDKMASFANIIGLSYSGPGYLMSQDAFIFWLDANLNRYEGFSIDSQFEYFKNQNALEKDLEKTEAIMAEHRRKYPTIQAITVEA
jgi:hypothetical protein